MASLVQTGLTIKGLMTRSEIVIFLKLCMDKEKSMRTIIFTNSFIHGLMDFFKDFSKRNEIYIMTISFSEIS